MSAIAEIYGNPPLKQGALIKCGWRRKSWKARWFVLDDKGHRLYYFSDKKSFEKGKIPKGSVTLAAHHRLENLEHPKYPHSFTLGPVFMGKKDRFYEIVARTDEERSEWMTILQECCLNLKREMRGVPTLKVKGEAARAELKTAEKEAADEEAERKSVKIVEPQKQKDEPASAKKSAEENVERAESAQATVDNAVPPVSIRDDEKAKLPGEVDALLLEELRVFEEKEGLLRAEEEELLAMERELLEEEERVQELEAMRQAEEEAERVIRDREDLTEEATEYYPTPPRSPERGDVIEEKVVEKDEPVEEEKEQPVKKEVVVEKEVVLEKDPPALVVPKAVKERERKVEAVKEPPKVEQKPVSSVAAASGGSPSPKPAEGKPMDRAAAGKMITGFIQTQRKAHTAPGGKLEVKTSPASVPSPSSNEPSPQAMMFAALARAANESKPKMTTQVAGGTGGRSVGKDALLLWCKQRCAPYGLEVRNFTTSWKSGLAFCALIHSYEPTLFEYDSLSPENDFDNLALAFESGEEIGLESYLDPEDIVELRIPDSKSIMTYLLVMKRFFATYQPRGR